MDDVRPDHIMQVGLGFWGSKTLLSAVEMEVFTELAKHPESLAELSARLGLHPRSAHDFFDALVALGFLERKDGVYSNTPASNLFLDKHKPSYIGGILEMANQRHFDFWNRLTTALRTGEPQNEMRDGHSNAFTAIYANPERLRSFLKAIQPWREHDHCTAVPIQGLQDSRGRWPCAGRPDHAGSPGESTSRRHWVRPA